MADLAQTVARWKSSAGTAQQRYTEGVQASQVDVVGRAIAAKAKLIQGFNDAVNSGRWERALGAKGTAGWKSSTVAKAGNYGTGINAGEQAYQAAMQVWLPITSSIAQQVKAMPNNSFKDSVARATAFMTMMHQAKLAR